MGDGKARLAVSQVRQARSSENSPHTLSHWLLPQATILAATDGDDVEMILNVMDDDAVAGGQRLKTHKIVWSRMLTCDGADGMNLRKVQKASGGIIANISGED